MKAKTLTGKWVVKEVSYRKAGKTFGEEFTQGYYFQFGKENRFNTSNSTGAYNGSWKIKGNTLTLTYGEKIEDMTIDYHSRDSLVLSIDLNREVLRFSLKKEKKPWY